MTTSAATSSTLPGSDVVKQLMHGTDWRGEDLTGWWATEKLNGCRAYWDGTQLWSRSGMAVKLSADWDLELPSIRLDCELYDGPDGVYRCATALRHGRFTPTMFLAVFDAPTVHGDWLDRMHVATHAVDGCSHVKALSYRQLKSNEHAIEMLRDVQSRGGEGLIVRRGDLVYLPGRTFCMLKVKSEVPAC